MIGFPPIFPGSDRMRDFERVLQSLGLELEVAVPVGVHVRLEGVHVDVEDVDPQVAVAEERLQDGERRDACAHAARHEDDGAVGRLTQIVSELMGSASQPACEDICVRILSL